MPGMNNLLVVFIGGGIGSLGRYLISQVIKTGSNGFPFTTFWVNITGCFAIGILYSIFSQQNQTLRIFFTVGLLGGYTTFSSFGLETIGLFQRGQYQTGFFYVILSNIFGLIAVYFGTKVSSLL